MTISHNYQNQLVQDRFALKLTARLSDACDDLPYEVTERLRAARVQAVGKRKVVTSQVVTGTAVSGGTLSLHSPDDGFSFWSAIASAIPLLALIVGLLGINAVLSDQRATELAEIDSALLTDTLPPSAYTDPGFAQFLKMQRESAR
ncbi:DUF3619 family protein [Rhodoferax sp.]|uniref:DUF3619 family protein n=1 Tax=Rhodoferax sp. TaxID=50421 RepID=UPI00277B42E9|nr:DUF3619 family protein [Rhodoferax sp.]